MMAVKCMHIQILQKVPHYRHKVKQLLAQLGACCGQYKQYN